MLIFDYEKELVQCMSSSERISTEYILFDNYREEYGQKYDGISDTTKSIYCLKNKILAIEAESSQRIGELEYMSDEFHETYSEILLLNIYQANSNQMIETFLFQSLQNQSTDFRIEPNTEYDFLVFDDWTFSIIATKIEEPDIQKLKTLNNQQSSGEEIHTLQNGKPVSPVHLVDGRPTTIGDKRVH
jgi:hypothetical protein